MKLNSLVKASFLVLGFFSLLCYPPGLKAQNATVPVSGKITDENDKGLEGVTIQVKGTSTNTISTADGSFRITAPHANSVLIFSYAGYAPQEVAVNNRSVVNISLLPNVRNLDEVIMVGYGTQKKSDITGALSRITAQTIQERPAQNVLHALQGKSAGVHVSSNFKPGELPVVRIRGTDFFRKQSRQPRKRQGNVPVFFVINQPMVLTMGLRKKER